MRVAIVTMLVCLGTSIPGWAQESGTGGGAGLKVAVVDMKKIFYAHPATAGAEDRVKKAREGARDAFREKTNALKGVLQQHQEKLVALEGASGSAAEKGRAEAAALLKKAREMEREIAEYKAMQEAELKQSFVEEKNKILESITEAVRAYNAEGNYHLILDKSAAAANGMPTVVDVKRLDDLTEEMIARLK